MKKKNLCTILGNFEYIIRVFGKISRCTWLIIFLIILSPFDSLAITTHAKQALLIDADTDEIIFEKNSNQVMSPSSMSKLMTMYIIFERLRDGDLNIADKILISKKAWRKQGSKMFVEHNQLVTVEDLIRGVIIQSGNDAAIALAEALAGSEEEFVIRMNLKAKELGLNNSHFANATGWPDSNHLMNSHDLAILAKKIINNFPEYYHYFSEQNFKFNGINQANRNLLLKKNIGVDGLKTGHSSAGGYGIVVSAVKDGRRLILVINGLEDERSRSSEAQKLLQYGFLNFATVNIAKKNTPLIKNIPTWLCSPSTINLVANKNINVTVPIDQKLKIKKQIEYLSPIIKPTPSTSPIGELIVTMSGNKKKIFKLYPQKDIKEEGRLSKIISKLKYYLFNFTTMSPKQNTKLISLK